MWLMFSVIWEILTISLQSVHPCLTLTITTPRGLKHWGFVSCSRLQTCTLIEGKLEPIPITVNHCLPHNTISPLPNGWKTCPSWLLWRLLFSGIQHIWYWQDGQHWLTKFLSYLNNILPLRLSVVTREQNSDFIGSFAMARVTEYLSDELNKVAHSEF